MTPDHRLRLQTMLRSMLDVVIPAIDSDHRLAIDQAQIIAGNIRLLLDQCDKAYEYEMAELREYGALLDALVNQLHGGAETSRRVAQARDLLAACAPIRRLAIPAQGELAAMVRVLKESVDGMVRAAHADGTPASASAASRLVLAQAEGQILRERVWFKQSGFELEPDRLPEWAALQKPLSA